MKLTNLTVRNLILCLAAGGLLLAACAGLEPVPTETPAAVVSATPTATIDWFPATDTPTFLPTQGQAPTLDYRPGLGGPIFSDTFDQAGLWDTASSDQASATITRNRLILSINGPGPLSIVSLRSQPVVGDFYAEATVDISLCSGKDQYGMLLRAAPGGNYYRLVVNCNGQLRLERVRGGESYPLLDWVTSGDASLGAPAQVKLGAWAVGGEIRIFLNDHYQFSASDPVFPSGTLGFFAYADGKTPVTVAFSSLAVYSVAYIFPTASPVPSWTPDPAATPIP
jgi:hypothetical protein